MWDVLRLDHFIIKSRAEFAAKRARGSFRGRNAGDWDTMLAFNDRNEVEDPMPPLLVERTKSEISSAEHPRSHPTPTARIGG